MVTSLRTIYIHTQHVIAEIVTNFQMLYIIKWMLKIVITYWNYSLIENYIIHPYSLRKRRIPFTMSLTRRFYGTLKVTRSHVTTREKYWARETVRLLWHYAKGWWVFLTLFNMLSRTESHNHNQGNSFKKGKGSTGRMIRAQSGVWPIKNGFTDLKISKRGGLGGATPPTPPHPAPHRHPFLRP